MAKSVLDFVDAFPNEESCIKYLEMLRWNGKVVSPFDPTSKVYKCSNGKYKCRNSGKYFDVKTGTVFAASSSRCDFGYSQYSCSFPINVEYHLVNLPVTLA